MRTKNFKECLLASTICAGSLFVAAPAMAQDRPAVQTPVTEEDAAIVITGSRIARRDLESSSPVAVVAAEEFQLSGTVNVEQVLNALPQVIPGTTAFSNNPGGGVATLNLRGLGTQRNLVLVNGRRWMFFDSSQTSDLNTIPQFLIDSVDVVTGGASAVYGSDAIGGVVNFRLRQDINGLIAGTQYNITERGDGARMNAYVAVGSEFADGRGSVTAFGEYFKRKSIFQGAREFSRFTQGEPTLNGVPFFAPVGSATVPQGRFAVAGSIAIAAGNALPAITLPLGVGGYANPNGGAIFLTPGTSSPYDGITQSYNFAPDNYLQVPQERYLLGGYGDYAITDNVTAYTEVTFINNRVSNELAPTPVTGTLHVNLAQNAQYLSAADQAALAQIDANETAINAARAARGLAPLFGIGAAAGVVQLSANRRMNDVTSRNALYETNSYRTLVGLKGDISENLNWDAYYAYSRSRGTNIQLGNISRSKYNAAVLNGTINIFGAGTLSEEDGNLISIIAQNATESSLQVASGSLSGSLFNIGGGAEDVGFALGAEYRKMASDFIPDTALSSGDVIGFNGGQRTAGSYNVQEVFAELRIPILAEQPFFYRLEATGAARYSDYSLANVGKVWTYAAGAEWAPTRDIMFRGQYQRAVRAPNVGELFGGRAQGFPGAIDPCSDRGVPADRTAALRQLCIDTGVPAANVFTAGVQPNAQIEGLFGGNPNLQEEVSDTYTVGAVVRPRFIPRFNLTVDYYHITLDGTISPAAGGVANILSLCYLTIRDANDALCQLIARDPTTGIIQSPYIVTATNVNIGAVRTSGVDFQLDYTQPLGFGAMSPTSKLLFSTLATYTHDYTIVAVATLPDDTLQCADRFGSGCGDPTARRKWNSRLSWIDGPLTTSVRWRHLSGTEDSDEAAVHVVENLPPYDVFDLSFSLDVTDSFRLAAGVNNILDKQPTVLGTNAQQAGTYPGTFDVLGRDYFVSASVRF
jgi:iron complex outermembrane receptor protein